MALYVSTCSADIVTDLRGTSGANGAIFQVFGLATAGDGNGGVYEFDTSSVVTDNGTSVIKPTAVSGAGRWLLIKQATGTMADIAFANSQIGFVLQNPLTSISGYTSSGSITATPSASGTALSGGDGSLSCYLQSNNSRSMYQTFKNKISYKPTSSTCKIALGVLNDTLYSNSVSTFMYINVLSTTTAQVQLGQRVGIVATSDTLTFTAGDTLTLTSDLTNNTVVITLSTSSSYDTVALTFNYNFTTTVAGTLYAPNNYYHTIHQLSGTGLVTDHSVYVTVRKAPYIAWVGDSITRGYTVNSAEEHFTQLLGSFFGNNTEIYAGINAKIENLNISEIQALNPKYLVVNIGRNNLGDGVSASAFDTLLQAFISSLSGIGYTIGTNVFFTRLLPSSVSVSPYNVILDSRVGSSIIDVYTPFKGVGTFLNTAYSYDQIHINGAGNKLYAKIIMARLGSILKPNYASFHNENILVLDPSGIGVAKGFQTDTLLNLQAKFQPLPRTGFLNFPFSNTAYPTKDGFAGTYFTYLGDDYTYISIGCYFNGSAFIATAQRWMIWGVNGSELLSWWMGTGATVGSAVTLVKAFSITDAGSFSLQKTGSGIQMKGGGSTARIGTLTLTSGTATVSNSSITANTVIIISDQGTGVLTGFVRPTLVTGGSGSITLTSTVLTDTAKFTWELKEIN